jgi:fumarylpyruvate hydrolase
MGNRGPVAGVSVKYLFAPPAAVTVPIVGKAERFPVHRVYCLVRNHAAHAKEMGFSGDDAPFFFLKAADGEALVVVEAGQTGSIRYASLTRRLHHEIEMVVAIGARGSNIKAASAHEHIYGYAVGLDMTRQDLLNDMAQKGRPWCIGKSFDHAGVIGPITPAEQADDIENAEIYLQVNGQDRQRSNVSRLIWNAAKIIEELSIAWELRPGDLIYTGTPEGVAPVLPGDTMEGGVAKLGTLRVQVTAN